MRERVTLADVAARAGTSRPTTHDVLAGRDRQMPISDDARRRVQEAAAEHGHLLVVCGTDDDPGIENHLVEELLDRRVTAISTPAPGRRGSSPRRGAGGCAGVLP